MRRLFPLTLLACASTALFAAPTFAHVAISSEDAAPGAPSTMVLEVENESSTAGTITVDLRFPEDATLTDVSSADVDGWTAEVTDGGIVWTGGPLTGSDIEEFAFTATLPDDAERLVFKTLETYDDGTVVRWIQTSDDPDAALENPAPILDLTGAAVPGSDHDHADGDHDTETTMGDHGMDHSDETSTSITTVAADNDSDESSKAPLVIGGIAVLAVAGGVVFMRARKGGTPSA